MTFAATITDSRGRQWISPIAPPLNLVRRFQWTLPASGQLDQHIDTGISASMNCVIFTRQLSGNQTFNGEMVHQNGNWQYRIIEAGTGNYDNPEASLFMIYVFANMADSTEMWGVRLFNARGDVVWSGDMLPLEIKTYDIPQTDVPVNIGHGVAVMPGVSQWAYVYDVDDGVYYYSSSFNARGNYIARSSTEVEDSVYANETQGVINRTCYYINTDIYDSF
ncbi:hypothetical protein ACI28F_005314 [Escherichia coli]|uniref:Uncharacterized protein n=1 Tax=Escherichia coli TaxID=562 RepID=A0AAP6B421_ECOLX|nr:hypothetical protein [Escherichia coli]HBC3162727.1 hypothetical protein [Escherichia coli O146]EEQ4619555.1 hypothetical protein [Escherichia coli]EEQ7473227.1 hypothetical protein [Escherichia coli]EEQ9383086.1 hypothetical protein [Escherichia coli]EES2156053.1 hypothetical protein [Escherichia coli]